MVQTFRIRFVFDDEAFEVKTLDFSGGLGQTGENFAVGGENRWSYDSFVNWDFLPSEDLPILVYFKVGTPESPLAMPVLRGPRLTSGFLFPSAAGDANALRQMGCRPWQVRRAA